MTVSKFVKVRNVGRFTDLSAAGAVQLSELTVIYGDNGSGKTTLAGVLRSLATGSPAFIDERQTLGAGATADVEILTSDGMAKFREGKWDKSLDRLEVFDSTFVSENVYTGDRVDAEHRKNLYEVVVGATAVALAKQIDELNSEGRRLARRISEIERELTEKIQTPFTLDDFLVLEPEDDLDEMIAAATTQLNAARQAEKVVARPQLQVFRKPDSPRDTLDVLAKQVGAVSREVDQKVRVHIRENLDASGEQWLRQGLGYATDDSCPFCGQSLDDRTLLDLYGQFFSSAYREHVIALRQALNSIAQRYTDEALGAVQRVATENAARIDTWSDLQDISAASAELDRLAAAWREMRARFEDALKRKLDDPGSRLADMEEVEAAVRDFEEAVLQLDDFNERIAEANTSIAELKKRSASADTNELEASLRRLRNQQTRQEAEVCAKCDELVQAREDKGTQEGRKQRIKTELQQQASSLLEEHEQDINRLLTGFGANFRITGTKPVFPGGSASSIYELKINGVALALGDGRTPRGTPCFKTALSAGDKSTLALAFFLAKLRRDSDLGSKTVVFDDPLSSLDSFRISFTQHELARIASKTKQTIILSHDPFFLQGVVSADSAPSAKTLRISRRGQSHTLREWEIDRECMPQAHKDYFILCRFMDEGLPDDGDLVTVARSIRPYVEGYLRLKYPDRFPSGRMLGWFIGTVRDADAEDDIAHLKDKIDALEDINAYARRFPHDNPGQTTEAEVQGYISKALELVRG